MNKLWVFDSRTITFLEFLFSEGTHLADMVKVYKTTTQAVPAVFLYVTWIYEANGFSFLHFF